MKKLAFGCMRLPMINDEVDIEQFKKMIDLFIENGFDYFDTAKVYLNGKSELALKEALTSRYSRDKFTFTDKLSSSCFKTKEDLPTLFEGQLKDCGLDYFDYYLIHAVNKNNIEHYENNGAFEFAKQMKEKGKIKHLGMSFHDSAENLDIYLSRHPEVEIVQLQINYIDFDDENVQSKKCYDVCVKHNKKVLVMEPVKGGLLVNVPDKAKDLLEKRNNGSIASYAIRFAASLPNVERVLSGMSTLEQIEDNISYMKDFKPLNNDEYKTIDEVVKIIKDSMVVPCTGCRYCVDGCPQHIVIPSLFECLNQLSVYNDQRVYNRYNWITEKRTPKASACIKCGKCEMACPQHIEIRNMLEKVADTFEQKS